MRLTAQRQVLPAQAAYEMWAHDYPPRPHNELMRVEQDAVIALLPPLSGLRVLDAGCGTGRYLHRVRALGATAVGVDLSGAMLAQARKSATGLARADLRALPFAHGTIDVVICALALGDVSELDRCLAEMSRVLRPGGRLVYSVVHPSGGERGWSRTFSINGRSWSIESYWHTAARHRDACTAAGLTVRAWREPVLGGVPAALVVCAER